MRIFYILIIIILNTSALGDEKNDSYFYIDANKLIIKKISSTSEFIGNVYATNGLHHFWGDKILINYDNSNKIKLITIINNVKIKRPSEEIFADEAIYNVKLEKIKISGNVLVIKDGNILNGDQLIVDLVNSTSIIEGSNEKQVSVKVVN